MTQNSNRTGDTHVAPTQPKYFFGSNKIENTQTGTLLEVIWDHSDFLNGRLRFQMESGERIQQPFLCNAQIFKWYSSKIGEQFTLISRDAIL